MQARGPSVAIYTPPGRLHEMPKVERPYNVKARPRHDPRAASSLRARAAAFDSKARKLNPASKAGARLAPPARAHTNNPSCL